MIDWPPPGHICDVATGEMRRTTAAEDREAARLLWKHRDLAGARSCLEAEPEPAPSPAPAHAQLELE
jgi:hypothetical protein